MKPYAILVALLMSPQASEASQPAMIQLVAGDETLVIQNMDVDLQLSIKRTKANVKEFNLGPAVCRWGPFEIRFGEQELTQAELKRAERVIDKISTRIKALQTEDSEYAQKVCDLLLKRTANLEKQCVQQLQFKTEDGVKLYKNDQMVAEFSIRKSGSN